ncbi:MAG: FG-GAP-like repeat-containing protein [Bacteroidetes bacterium]|nr:FG-GAP-like repeat-containing protein [Bacteroidota bacterium]
MTFKFSFTPFIGVCLLLGMTSKAQFIDRALEYGIDHRFIGMGFGSGLSLVDINGDGKDDLTLGTGLGNSLAVYLQSDTGFTLVNEASLLEVTQAVRGLNWVDYDNDGDKDLFITYWNVFTGGGLSLYNQDESGHFIEVTWSAGLIPANAPFYGSTWADYDNDGFLDLYICNYSTGTFGRNPLYHNNGNGTFTEMSVAMGVDDTQGYSFNSIFFDADMDGDLDLFTSNDRGAENRLYQNLNNMDLQDVSALTGMNAVLNAMGAELGDFDNDQDFDIYVTNTTGTFQGHVGNALFRNDGPGFQWLPGNPAEHNVGTFWGCNFIDYDYDRDLDLFTVNSNRLAGAYSRYFYINDGNGSFSDYPGNEFQIGNGNHFATAQGDLNSDGYLDLVVADGQLGTSQIWIGPATNNHWVKVHLEGTVSNRDGIGALIEVWANGEKRIDQTTCTSSHLSQDSNSYPFGLGNYPQADTIIIRWPSGIVNKVYGVPCEHRIHVVENHDQETIDCLPEVELNLELSAGLLHQFSFYAQEDFIAVHWSINGEVVGTDDTLYYEFPELGEFEVCLSVSNSCTSETWCETIEVTCSTPEPEVEWSQDLLTLTMDLTNAFDSVIWSLGDGSQVIGPSFIHTYDSIGVYTLCVQVFDQCGMDSLCFDIEITCPLPSAGFSFAIEDLELTAMSTSLNSDSLIWTWNGGPISEESTVSLTADIGQNELCLFAFNPCGSDSICSLFDISPVGLPVTIEQSAVSLFPNPAHDRLLIQWKSHDVAPMSVRASDIRGRQIPLVIPSHPIDSQTLSLDVSHLDSGLYWLELQWPSGEVLRLAFSKE